MGEGVPQIVGLVADLVLSQGKLFLIEELENDLHPQALKALLRLMIESSARNQFVVTTHSNIVLRYHAAEPNSIVYSVAAEPGARPPSSRTNRSAASQPTASRPSESSATALPTWISGMDGCFSRSRQLSASFVTT